MNVRMRDALRCDKNESEEGNIDLLKVSYFMMSNKIMLTVCYMTRLSLYISHIDNHDIS